MHIRLRNSRIPASIPALLFGFLLVTLALPASAAVPAGKVTLLRGTVTATGTDGQIRRLSKKADIYAGDKISTSRRSVIRLRLQDGSKFTLGSRAQMKVSKFVYGRTAKQDVISTRILKGVFRFVSGLIAKHRPRSMNVRLGNVATIGIRGTDVSGEVIGDSATVVLNEPKQAGTKTAIDVSNDHGSVAIDKPGWGTTIPDANSPPTPARRMRLKSIENLMRSIQSMGRISTPRPRMH